MNEQNRSLLSKGRRKWHNWVTTHQLTRTTSVSEVSYSPDPHGNPKKIFRPHFMGEQTKVEKAETFTPNRISGKQQNQRLNSRCLAPEAKFAKTTLSYVRVGNRGGATPGTGTTGLAFVLLRLKN